ncbi:MAG TPA: hypothetical protein VGI60_01805 [Chthoniobacterales bacterium]
MGTTNGAYKADFPVGTRVRIGDRAELERFHREWKLHNPLQAGQLEFAGRVGTIVDVGYYHGGDELYQLQDVPGIWHECCLHLLHDSTSAP